MALFHLARCRPGGTHYTCILESVILVSRTQTVTMPAGVLVTTTHRRSHRKVIVEALTGCLCNTAGGMDCIASFLSSSTKRETEYTPGNVTVVQVVCYLFFLFFFLFCACVLFFRGCPCVHGSLSCSFSSLWWVHNKTMQQNRMATNWKIYTRDLYIQRSFRPSLWFLQLPTMVFVVDQVLVEIWSRKGKSWNFKLLLCPKNRLKSTDRRAP